METRLDLDLFADESWREHMHIFCHDGYPRARETEDEAFARLKEAMDDTEWDDPDEPFQAIRLLVEWALKYRIDGIAALLYADMLHVGRRLFPQVSSGSHSPGFRSRSLMAIAARDVCSPEAVDFLLSRGADPEAEMYEGGWPEPTSGPGSLAIRDVAGDWKGSSTDKAAIIRSLCLAGADAYLPYEKYHAAWCDCKLEYPGVWKRQMDACWALCEEQAAKRARDTRVKIGNMVALIGIVSFWRRLAAAPGSAAAKKARLRFERAAA